MEQNHPIRWWWGWCRRWRSTTEVMVGGNGCNHGDSSAFWRFVMDLVYFPSGTSVTPLTGTKVSLSILNTDNDNDGLPNS